MMNESIAPDIQEMPIFRGLQEKTRRYLQSRLRRFYFSPGNEIIQQGKRGQFIGLVGHGLIDLEKPDGTIQTLLPGEFFGEQMLRLDQPAPYTARARSDASLWVLTRSDWLSAIKMPDAQAKRTPARPRKRFSFSRVLVLILLIGAVVFLSPELPELLNHRLIQTLQSSEQSELTEAYLNLALSLEPDSSLLHEELGKFYYQGADYLNSVDAFRRATTLDGSSASAQNNLGVAYLAASRPQEAVLPLKLASELDPGNAEIFYNLGNAFLANGDRVQAADAYRRATELDPDQVESRVQLAGVLMTQGDITAAAQTWEEILAREPEQAAAQRGRGIAAMLEERPMDSIEDLKAALLENPVDPVTHLYLGLAYKALGDTASAVTEFEVVRMLTSDPALIDLAQAQLQELGQSNGQ